MTAVCPCCGNEIRIDRGIHFSLAAGVLISSDYVVVFTKNEADVFDVIWGNRNTGRIIPMDTLFDRLYGDDPNGGPDSKVIDVLLYRIRKKLEPTDLEIVNIKERGFFIRSKTSKPQESIA